MGLMNIGEYVFKIAKIIASAINEEVVICDEDGHFVGDSKKHSLEEVWHSYINDESIFIDAMRQKSLVLKENIKDSLENCQRCKNANTCDINSIIALPIIKEDKVIGCIGIYSKNKSIDKYSSERTRFLIDFTSEMSELILGKLSEDEENSELTLLKGQLQDIIENMDKAVACISTDGIINHVNLAFKKLFGIEGEMPENILQIAAIAKCQKFCKHLSSDKGVKECQEEFSFEIKNKVKSIYATIKPIDTNNSYRGKIIYFKEASDYYNEINKLSNGFSPVDFDDIIGESPQIIQIKKQTMLIAKSTSTVLIQGESGTGKEIFSRAIHNASNRSNYSFITVNCAAIPDNLLESELFGYEEGAFTGAVKGGRVGKFQLANKGTLFLDEIGEVPIHLQAKLLRALQEKKIQKVGGNRDIDIDIRIIAATNRNLESMIKTGEFREDLFYRLNVIPIMIPPLRERKSDIPVLLDFYIQNYNRILNKNIKRFSNKAVDRLLEYDWPGNIRELQNMIEYCVNIAQDDIIDEYQLPKKIINVESTLLLDEIRPLEEIEKNYIKQAISLYGDDLIGKKKAANALGIGIATLYRKIK